MLSAALWSLWLTLAVVQPTLGAEAILGYWHGKSVCVRADWNAACNDEEVVYDFQRSSQRAHPVFLRAYKRVNGKFESMFDLDLAYRSNDHRWFADFANSRVRIQWRFWARSDTLWGEVELRPSRHVGRHVLAVRDTVRP